MATRGASPSLRWYVNEPAYISLVYNYYYEHTIYNDNILVECDIQLAIQWCVQCDLDNVSLASLPIPTYYIHDSTVYLSIIVKLTSFKPSPYV